MHEYNVSALDKWTHKCHMMLNYGFNLSNEL